MLHNPIKYNNVYTQLSRKKKLSFQRKEDHKMVQLKLPILLITFLTDVILRHGWVNFLRNRQSIK